MKRTMTALLLLTLPALSLADQRTVPVRDATWIQDDRGNSRLLFRLDEILPGQGIAVSRASLVLPLAGVAIESRARLRAYAVTREWAPGAVGWTGGWTRPGGDFDEDIYVPVDADLSRGFLVVDLTPLVKEWAEGEADYHGFVLTTDPADRVGLPSPLRDRLGSISGAEVHLSYVRVPRVARR